MRCFTIDKKSESYKLFWFQAIVNKVIAGKQELIYNELVDEMIFDAWYMVSEYKLNLGPSDNLEALIHYVKQTIYRLIILFHGLMWHMMSFGIFTRQQKVLIVARAITFLIGKDTFRLYVK